MYYFPDLSESERSDLSRELNSYLRFPKNFKIYTEIGMYQLVTGSCHLFPRN